MSERKIEIKLGTTWNSGPLADQAKAALIRAQVELDGDYDHEVRVLLCRALQSYCNRFSEFVTFDEVHFWDLVAAVKEVGSTVDESAAEFFPGYTVDDINLWVHRRTAPEKTERRKIVTAALVLMEQFLDPAIVH